MKAGLFPLHGLLDHGGVDHVLVLAHQRQDRLDQELEDGAFVLGDPGVQARWPRGDLVQLLVEDELVAVLHQHLGGAALGSQSNDVLAVLLQLGSQGGEVAVPGQDDEGVDVFLGVAQVHGVHAEPDIGRILSRPAPLGDVDELEGGFVQLLLVFGEARPVGIRFLDQDLPLLHQSLQDLVDAEPGSFPALLHTQSQIFQIQEEGQAAFSFVHEAKLSQRTVLARVERQFRSRLACGNSGYYSSRPTIPTGDLRISPSRSGTCDCEFGWETPQSILLDCGGNATIGASRSKPDPGPSVR